LQIPEDGRPPGSDRLKQQALSSAGAPPIVVPVSLTVYPFSDIIHPLNFNRLTRKETAMPYFSIETNQTTERASNPELMKKTSAFIAGLLGKPESYVMISIKPRTPLIFGGSDAPAAFVRLESIGLPRDRCADLSAELCRYIEEELDVPRDRIFVDFRDLERNMFGWNGKTF
jgi:phenylpyruvate tautomerase PptA (4-oxalocrotonate tautomerase family)